MASTTNSRVQTSTKREPFFVELKVGKVHTKYKAWVGNYVVHGITTGDEGSVKALVYRMAEAKAELVDKVRDMVSMVADNVARASESGLADIGMTGGTYFHLGEYMAVMVKFQRIRGHDSDRWWGVVRVVFKGFDGLRAVSKHVVERYVEFYSDKISRDKLYTILYDMARIAFNAYVWVAKVHYSSEA